MRTKNWITNGVLVFTISATLLSAQNAGAWGQFNGGHRPPMRNPVVVHNVYVNHGGNGCVGCGVGLAAVAGLATGVIVGAAIARPQPQTVYVAQPVPTMVIASPQMGAEYGALPPGCQSMNVNGVNYFQCGPTWYQPFVGGNGVYYQVVPTP
jgi:hypothetical protein